MLKETITYNDLDGNKITEDFYFHMTKADVIEWNFSEEGGLEEHIKRIQETQDQKQIIKLLKDIILMSFGRKSEDGIRFIKREEDALRFRETDAYSELFMKLASDEKELERFIKGILPKDLPQPQDKKAPAKKKAAE